MECDSDRRNAICRDSKTARCRDCGGENDDEPSCEGKIPRSTSGIKHLRLGAAPIAKLREDPRRREDPATAEGSATTEG